MAHYVSQREFARAVGVSSVYSVEKALKNGRISKSANGKIDLDTELPKWHQNQDISKVRGNEYSTAAPSSGGPSLADLKRAREGFEVQLRRLKYEQLNGKLVERVLVKKAVSRIYRNVRDTLQSIPERVAAEEAAAMQRYMKRVLTAHLSPEQVNEILADMDATEIGHIAEGSWKKEERAVMENMDKSIEAF